MLLNDPAADPEVERVARIFCEHTGQDPDQMNEDGDPLWRSFVTIAVSAIAAHRTLTG